MTAATTFRQTDLKRAIKAAQQAGINVTRIEIAPDGKVTLHTNDGQSAATTDDDVLNKWVRDNAARKA